MKRLGLTLAAAVCLTAGVFAAGNQPTTAKWEGNINVTKLGKYLKLDAGQHEEVTNICEYFTEQMERAASSKKNQEKLLRDAVYGNLKLMKRTLTEKQYADYARVLNVTLQNKGIEVK
ncbi:hypothetical protein JN06_00640 [Bacteroides zoogleoformans]|uniref:Uncharacterized protein n=1 Tax=Bacteroides zoogleoformans TaxID=28119 RepID=A0ABM6T711_9BACE|nr:hypothetical protein [Bacteroides zoogleoformans]AVM52629.1 hypothetical protein C4H11_06480 [Bacteroides zoogleoformans]TWJ17697.1 hypothetical protein JN06_00640 [Bacteroides zoogleoformans]